MSLVSPHQIWVTCTGVMVGLKALSSIFLFTALLYKPHDKKMIELCMDVAEKTPGITSLVVEILNNPDVNVLMQFLLDCSVIPAIISLVQTEPPFLYFSDLVLHNPQKQNDSPWTPTVQIGLGDFNKSAVNHESLYVDNE